MHIALLPHAITGADPGQERGREGEGALGVEAPPPFSVGVYLAIY